MCGGGGGGGTTLRICTAPRAPQGDECRALHLHCLSAQSRIESADALLGRACPGVPLQNGRDVGRPALLTGPLLAVANGAEQHGELAARQHEHVAQRALGELPEELRGLRVLHRGPQDGMGRGEVCVWGGGLSPLSICIYAKCVCRTPRGEAHAPGIGSRRPC